MKKKIAMIFVSLCTVFGIVFGSLLLCGDGSVFVGTDVVSETEDDETSASANTSGNWIDNTAQTFNDISYYGSHVLLTITTSGQLALFMYYVNNNCTFNNGTGIFYASDAYVYLDSDVDMSAHYWTPIGNGSHKFTGKFYGRGHTISGLYIDMAVRDLDWGLSVQSGFLNLNKEYGIGFFGVTEGATIEDFILKGGEYKVDRVFIRALDINSYGVLMGSVVGFAYGDSNNISEIYNFNTLTYYNSSNNATWYFKGTSALGGIIGGADQYIWMKNCYNFGKLSTNTLSDMSVGGILAFADRAHIEGCGNFADVTGNVTWDSSSGFGGIVGSVGTTKGSYIYDCVNYGDIKIGTTSSGSYQGSFVAGIVGLAGNNTVINRCINYGKVQGSSYVGGIAGRMGTPAETSSFLWWSWESKSAQETVLVSNCMNYGDVSASSKYGAICGEMNGSENIKGCYSAKNITLVGNWNNGSVAEENAKYSTDMYDYNFYLIRHSYDFSGVQSGFWVTGWNDGNQSYACLNGDVETEASSDDDWVNCNWTITPFIYDYFSGVVNGFNSKYQYSLVPSGMIGYGQIIMRYYDSQTGDYTVFGSDEYENQVSVSYKQISLDGTVGYVTQESNLECFYYIKGISSYPNDANVRPLITFDTNKWGVDSITTSRSITGSLVKKSAEGTKTTYYIKFDQGMYGGDLAFTIKVKSVAQKISVRYMLGSFTEQGTYTTQNAYYTFTDITKNITVSTTAAAILYSTNVQSKSYYYKGSVNVQIRPNYGYAILYVLNQDSSTPINEYNDEISVGYDSKNNKCQSVYNYITDDYGNNVAITGIKPSNYGLTYAKYNYVYDKELVVYIVPLYYAVSLNMGSESVNEKITVAFKNGEDDGWGTSLSSESRTCIIYSKYNVETNGHNYNLNCKDSNYYSIQCDLKYGYKYRITMQATGTYTDSSGNACKSTNVIGASEYQLDGNMQLRFDLYSYIQLCLGTGHKHAGDDTEYYFDYTNIIINLEATPIEYTVNFTNMVDSYSNPKVYNSSDNGSIGGTSTCSSTRSTDNSNYSTTGKFKVSDTLYYAFTPKAGYSNEYINTSFFRISSLTSDNVMLYSNNASVSFQTFLDKYVAGVLSYYVSRFNNTINIYVYYTLETFSVNLYYQLDNGDVKEDSNTTGVTLSVTGADASKNGNAYTVYYYQPITITAGTYTNRKFVGWYLKSTNTTGNLLSLSKTYSFFANPTKSLFDGGLNFVAKFASYTTTSTTLSTSSKIIDIDSADKLVALSQAVAKGNDFSGYTIRQTKDIDMSGITFNPIGTSTTSFKGTYDGQNHLISNLAFSSEQNLMFDIGLFGYTDGATIKNLTIKDSTFGGFARAGLFVANATNTKMQFLNAYNSSCELVSLSAVDFYNIYNEKIDNPQKYYYYMQSSSVAELKDFVSLFATLFEEARGNIGGLVGKMSGGSLYASSVNSKLTLGVTSGTIKALVGGMSDDAKIDQSMVENKSANDYSLANDEASLTDCYYRYGSTTNFSNANTTDKTKWLTLPSGELTLKVLYWS